MVAITGTNGKTTTSRMLGHIAQRAGMSVGWSSTDGVYINGELVEAGDYSGPSGAGQVLSLPGRPAGGHRDGPRRHPAPRGRGRLQRRLGGDQHQRRPSRSRRHRHPGPARRGQGGDHQDHQADRLVRAERRRPADLRDAAGHKAQVWVFTRDPDSPTGRTVLDAGGRVTTVLDGWVCVLRGGRDPLPVVEVVDVPMTLAGLSRVNVENVLAVTSAALALGFTARRRSPTG